MVEWKTMTPQEAWDLLLSAPRIAGVWGPAGIGHPESTRARKDVRGHVVALDYGPGDVTTCLKPGCLPDRGAADAALREAGWLLVDEPGTNALIARGGE